MGTAAPDLSALLKRANIDDHEAVLRACNSTLKKAKGDLATQHVKTVALLKLERFDDALRTLEAGGDELKQRAKLENAYALYKDGKYDEARAIVKDIPKDRGAKHLHAQVSYRQENFSAAADLYQELSSTQATIDNEVNDLRINSGAADAQLEWDGQGNLVRKKKAGREDLEAFETAYNAACGSIARGELEKSEILLKRAKDLCNASDELSDAEKLAESLPISVQQLYVLIKEEKCLEAQKLAEEITFVGTPDQSTRQIGQNNKLASAASPPNPYLSQRLFQDMPALPENDQFFRYQAERMRQNSLALDLFVGKASAVVSSTLKDLSSESSRSLGHMNKLSVINAAAQAQNELGKLGLKEILPLMEKRPTDVGLALTIVQLYILTNNHGSALTVVESLLNRLSSSDKPSDADARFAPGLIATFVSLCRHQNRRSQIKAELARAASYWRHKSKRPVSLLNAAGLALLESSRSDDQEAAREIFFTLHNSDPSSPFAIAGYVASQVQLPHVQATKEVESLTPVPRLTAGIDVSALEAAGVPTTSAGDNQSLKRKRVFEEKPKPAKKRVKKSRLPKNYDPDKQPDPERWLPLRDRSTYKPKGKKGKKKAEQLTQGGISERVEGNKGSGEGVIQAKSGGGGGGGKKGGKKKGKK
ncbi:MAG: hypothetical protein Q9191_000942 [Dirinaria sp. TL-2023a]